MRASIWLGETIYVVSGTSFFHKSAIPPLRLTLGTAVMESNYSSCRIGSISLTLCFHEKKKSYVHFSSPGRQKLKLHGGSQALSSSRLWRSLCSVGLDHSLHRYCSWRTKVLRSFTSLLSVLHTYGTLPRKSMKASLRSYTCHGRLLLHHGPKLVLYNFFPSWLFLMCHDEAIHAIHVG